MRPKLHKLFKTFRQKPERIINTGNPGIQKDASQSNNNFLLHDLFSGAWKINTCHTYSFYIMLEKWKRIIRIKIVKWDFFTCLSFFISFRSLSSKCSEALVWITKIGLSLFTLYLHLHSLCEKNEARYTIKSSGRKCRYSTIILFLPEILMVIMTGLNFNYQDWHYFKPSCFFSQKLITLEWISVSKGDYWFFVLLEHKLIIG